MNRLGITDIFFDLDHTLWDFERNSALTYGYLFKKHALGIDLDAFLKVYVPENFRLWKLYREGKMEKETLRYTRLKTVFDTLGIQVSRDLIFQLADDYIANLSTHPHLFPDAMSILQYLNSKYRLHIITNGFEEVQDKKLKNSKIDHFFIHVVNSEMAGVKKPDRRIFELALDKAGIHPDRGIMIGDSLEADVLGAKAVGLEALHFNSNNEPLHEFSPVITSLKEIKLYL